MLRILALILLGGAQPCFADTSDELFLRINQERTAAGLAPLTRSPKLDQLASEWAATMACNNAQSHRPLSKSLLNTNGWKNLSENIYGPTADGSASAIFRAWMGSSGHRENLLRESTTLGGIGIAKTKSGAICAVFNGAKLAPRLLLRPPPQTQAQARSPSLGSVCPILFRNPCAILPPLFPPTRMAEN